MPVIISPTTEQTITVSEGEQAAMTIIADHAEAYQWYINYNDGTGWHKKVGETAASYTTSPTKLENNGYLYRCDVIDENGNTVNSPIFTLKVLRKPVIPQTGDEAQIGMWLALMSLSFAGCMMILARHKRRKI